MADDDFHTRSALEGIMTLLERKLWLTKNDADAVKEINDHIKAIRAKGDKARKSKELANATAE